MTMAADIQASANIDDLPRTEPHTVRRSSGWNRLSSALYENDRRLTKTEDVILFLLACHPKTQQYNGLSLERCVRATGVSASLCYKALRKLVGLGYARRNQRGEYKFLGDAFEEKNDRDAVVHGLCGNCGAITTGTIPGYMPTLPELATKFPCCVTGDGWRLMKLIYRECVWHKGGDLIVKRTLAWTIRDFAQALGWAEGRAQAALKELLEAGALPHKDGDPPVGGAIERAPDPVSCARVSTINIWDDTKKR
jgi:hypothetical protein